MKTRREQLFFVFGYLVPWEIFITDTFYHERFGDIYALCLLCVGLVLPMFVLCVVGYRIQERPKLKRLWWILFGLQSIRTIQGLITFLFSDWFHYNHGFGRMSDTIPMAIFVPSLGCPFLRILTIPIGVLWLYRASKSKS